MISRNNMGDNGSPWHNPQPWWIVSPGAPLRMIHVLAIKDDSCVPMNSSTSRRKAR
jgi:hypothetical protein